MTEQAQARAREQQLAALLYATQRQGSAQAAELVANARYRLHYDPVLHATAGVAVGALQAELGRRDDDQQADLHLAAALGQVVTEQVPLVAGTAPPRQVVASALLHSNASRMLAGYGGSERAGMVADVVLAALRAAGYSVTVDPREGRTL